MKILNKNKKLNIAIVQQSPDIGGAETYMLNLALEFIRLGYSVTVVTNKGKYYDLLVKNKIKVINIPLIFDIMGNLKGFIKSLIGLSILIPFYVSLLKMFKKEKVDVLLATNFSEKLLVSFLTLFVKIPIVWIEYGPLKPIFKRNFYFPKLCYFILKRIPYKIIVPSKSTYNSLIADAKVEQRSLSIVPCGVRIKNQDLYKNTGDINRISIGSVSRLAPEKGQEYLIKAMPYVVKHIPNAILTVAGSGPDKDRLLTLIRELKMEKKIKLLGFVEDLEKYYKSLDIFVFPSYWELEGFGLVTIEAMSYGIPVVVSKIGPTEDIIGNEKNGIFVEPRHEQSIANAVINLAKNAHKREVIGREGYDTVLRKFDLKKTSRLILDELCKASFSAHGGS